MGHDQFSFLFVLGTGEWEGIANNNVGIYPGVFFGPSVCGMCFYRD